MRRRRALPSAVTSWHPVARGVAQRAGLDPRYLRRLRWISKSKAVRTVGARTRSNLAFVLTDPEPNNFTYELANQSELVAWIQAVSRCELAQAQEMVLEARGDLVLHTRLRAATAERWWWSKPSPPFGKRLAWYALARLLKPELIVETGVHDGLGSLLLLRALERNAEEHREGRLMSFDINPAAGWIVGKHPLWDLRIESTRAGLSGALAESATVGMFIHDSLHTYENEHYELHTAALHLAPSGVLVSDNAHVTTALAEICQEFGLIYYEFRERPDRHFYPGGAMGAGRA
jgi:hypothetical protein